MSNDTITINPITQVNLNQFLCNMLHTHLSIGFLGYLMPWKPYENVYSLKMVMPHPRFIVTTCALHIYTLQSSATSIPLNNRPRFLKQKRVIKIMPVPATVNVATV